ncbi:PREDICTED: leucine-rich repeat protein 1 isoform X1 [Polistes dominula]|uniref:Leucine-rich repeat protein 1 isoform X1 n=1 Tax=Polistes dominula TaxID=743375 RepID=A0ABM1J3K6_POLDO|nr:PREDICTED: leucine-rich repeat protein 1 isoform X1 [Polistes dominula]
MKINCRVQVSDRTLNVLHPLLKRTPEHGCLVIGRQSIKNNELYILLQTLKNQCRAKYKVNDNIEMIFDKFIGHGKATIRIKEPPHDLLIQSDPISLKGFIRVVKLVLSKKVNLSTIAISNLNTKKIPNAQRKKLVIKNNVEYPTLKGFPRYTEELIIDGLNRKSFDLQILRLNNLKVLNLSNNQIRSLPKDLGSMQHLQELILSGNRLGKDANTKWDWLDQDNIKKNLCLLDLSSNCLTEIPNKIGKLNGLVNLKLGVNLLTVLPRSMRRLTSLRYLDLSHNCLQYLPEGIRKLQIIDLNIRENPFEVVLQSHCHYSILVPSLVDCAAEIILNTSMSYDASIIPRTLVTYLDSATYCICGKVCFQNCIRKILYFKLRFPVVRYSFGDIIPFECYLCSSRCYNLYGNIV